MSTQQAAESYYGENLTNEECDEIALSAVERKLYLGKESELFDKKWFDYRFLHPVKATYLYADHYLKSYKDVMKVRYDYRRAEFMKPIKGLKSDIFQVSKRNISAFWKGRQSADKLGIPYDFYTSTALIWAERRGWKYLPQPIQMYSAQVQDHVADKWLEELSIKIVLPTAAQMYQSEGEASNEIEEAFDRYLYDLVMSRQNKALIIAQLFDKLGVERTQRVFGEELIQQAKSFLCFK